MHEDSFPRLSARTQRFTLGEPRSFVVSRDGAKALFLRSDGPTDSVNKLWLRDVQTGSDSCLADPRALGASTDDMTPAERARRERLREGAGGITGFTVSRDFSRAVFSLAGRLFAVDVSPSAVPRDVGIEPGIFDPKVSPPGNTIAFIRGGSLCITDLDGNAQTLCAEEAHVTWGMAEFIAAEEMGRFTGFWWSPDGNSLIVERVDTSRVGTWHIADPAHPEAAPVVHAYPSAGTTNATTELFLVDARTGERHPISFPEREWEYITAVHWSSVGAIVQLQSRDQKTVAVCDIDVATGTATIRQTDSDSCWVDLVPGVPALNARGQVVTTSDRLGVRRLFVDGSPVSPPDVHVRQVIDVDDDIIFIAHSVENPATHQLWRTAPDGTAPVALSSPNAMVTAWGNSRTTVTRETTLESRRAAFTCGLHPVESNAAELPFLPNVTLHHIGPRRIPVAVVAPRERTSGRLPVLMNPYGGPHAQRVVSSAASFAESQWFADQGFIVVIVDGAGTPGHGSAWEREVAHDLARPVLADQISVLDVLGSIEPRADLDRVGIRGWSFGGYLAALAVMSAPDRFHCAVAGAPVTEWRLYDTHYTERYLGHPSADSGPYEATSLIPLASRLSRPLLLIHGLADDNVVAAHTLQLSSALLAAGKPHEVLPLSGVTHMTPQEHVAENLLLHQLDFLRRHLGA